MTDSAPQGFPWPDGYRAAAALTFDVDAETPLLHDDPTTAMRLGLMSHQMFGPKVGVPRILDILARWEIRGTFFIPGYTALRYPDLVRRVVAEGHEVGHHGFLHEPLRGLTPEAELRLIDRGLAALADVAGVQPVGFRAPVGEISFHTPALLAQRGFDYDSSLMDSDAPYLLSTSAGTLVELPFHWSTDDWEQYNWIPGIDDGRPIETPAKAVQVWRSELDGQLRYGGLFTLVNHPFVSGRAARMVELERFIADMRAEPTLWIAPLQAIATHVRSLDLEPVVHAPYSLDDLQPGSTEAPR
jgi:peptidoglycan/xylan/chitin deacetylase (PgdA/CDA1 family)